MKFAAASWFSFGMPAGMPTPAPPVGQTGLVAFGPPGRAPVPTSKVAALRMPTRLPVEAIVELTAPAERSVAWSLLATPAHLSL